LAVCSGRHNTDLCILISR